LCSFVFVSLLRVRRSPIETESWKLNREKSDEPSSSEGRKTNTEKIINNRSSGRGDLFSQIPDLISGAAVFDSVTGLFVALAHIFFL
jgi:hypothetical protein